MPDYPKQDIKDRSDVSLLVTSFYARIRAHGSLGPFFNETIKDWPEHLERLTDFWESQLFLNKKYHGNPITVHQEVDSKFDHCITMEHFGQWLELWIATLDDLFTGDRAWIAKNRARKMATMFYLKIYENRP